MNNEMNNGLGPNTMPTPEQPVQSVPTAPVDSPVQPTVAPVAPTPVEPTPVAPQPMPTPVAPTPVAVEPVQQPVPQPVTPQPMPVPQPVPVETPAVPPMEPPTTPPTNDVVNNGNNEETPKKKKSKLPLIIIAIIALLAILGFVGFKVLLNDKQVMKLEVKLLSKGANTALEAMLKKAEVEDNTAITGYKGELTIDSDYKSPDGLDLSKLKNYKIMYNTATDPVKNQMSARVTLVNQTMSLADVKALVDGDYAYLSLGDMFAKVIKTDASELHLNTNKNNVENIKAAQTLIKKTEPILVNYIDKQEITKSKEERTINGKTKKYNKVSAEFNLTELEKTVITEYLKDDEAIKALSVIAGQDEKELKETLQQSLETESTDTEDIVTLNTYKTTFSTTAEEMEIIFGNTENATRVIIDNLKDKSEYHIFNGETEMYNGTFTDDTITVKDTQGMIDLSLTVKEEDFKGSFNINTEATTMKATFTSTTKDKTTDTVVKMSMTMGEDKFNVTINNKLEKLDKAEIETLDTTNAVPMEQLTETDMQLFQMAYQQKLNLLLADFMTVQYRMQNNILQ